MPDSPKLVLDQILYGGDYNPDQWLDRPEILTEDLRFMNEASVNVVSLGIFAWATLEPEEGRFDFSWLDERINALTANGQKIILATPSGAKPNWMAAKYPEIRRVDQHGIREPQNGRHNHCLTSPVYRKKVALLNAELAKRYANHPALVLWHVSNEFGGYCYCDKCMSAFRDWLKARYETLANLNHAWWANFWSHTFTDWEQIVSIDESVNAMVVDWKRFMTEQCKTFIANEVAPLRQYTPTVPVTVNYMTLFGDYDYWELAKELDVICWDSYPGWHDAPNDTPIALRTSFVHDQMRAFKADRPWLLMECTPSVTNWRGISKPKRPGVHRAIALASLAHGSDAVMHFQFRKGRGSCEQFHGAYVDHSGNQNRIFREMAEIGSELKDLAAVTGTQEPAQAAVVYDWNNRWCIEIARGPRNDDKNYDETCIEWYRPLWEAGVPTHVIDQTVDLSSYKLVIAPMSMMIRPGFAEKVQAFVENGGTFVTTYLSGWVDQDTNAFQTGFPGPLRKLLGIWAEEMDVLAGYEAQTSVATKGNSYGLNGAYSVEHFAEVIHLEGAEELAHFGGEYYAGSPSVTVNKVGKGQAIFVASRNDARFQSDLISRLIDQASVKRALPRIPTGVNVQVRGNFLFAINWAPETKTLDLNSSYVDAITGDPVSGSFELVPYAATVLRKA